MKLSNTGLAAMLMLTGLSPALVAQKAAAPAVEEILAWPPPPAAARIKWVAEYRNEFDLGAKKKRGFLDRLAGRSEDVLWLKRPMSVAIDEQGTMFVGDFGQGIVGMDPKGKRMWLFSSVSSRTLPTPSGLAVDSKQVFATDSNTNALVAFDKSGRQLAALGAQDGVKRPVGVAVDESRDLVVMVNGGDHTVWMLNRAFKVIKKVGQRGEKPGQFNYPTYCCIIPGKGFAVADSGNFRIQVFDFNGRYLSSFGKAGDATGQFARPKGLAVDPDGQLYVVDGAFSNIQVFRMDGQVLTFIGQGGTGKGQFQVPNGISISKDGAILVADQLNARIQKFQYLPAPPAPPASAAPAPKGSASPSSPTSQPSTPPTS
jgi:DNA-binding beta-propeller fold protein YncE